MTRYVATITLREPTPVGLADDRGASRVTVERMLYGEVSASTQGEPLALAETMPVALGAHPTAVLYEGLKILKQHGWRPTDDEHGTPGGRAGDHGDWTFRVERVSRR